jgi:hypothetical protein
VQLFPAYADTIFRIALGSVAGLGILVPVLLLAGERSPVFAQTKDERDQPVKFDHRHHARDDGIACLYCHDGARRDRWAGVPDAATCMGCHNQIWTNSPEVRPVREAVANNRPLVWNRIHDLPDHVFFHHGVHVRSGVECEECHGRVDLMPAVYAKEAMTMSWCLDCHRQRAAPTNCTTCHR